MPGANIEELRPSAAVLVDNRVASRLHAKDESLYGFSQEAHDCARDFMGWTDLASNPPCSLSRIRDFACRVHESGFDTFLLLGEGGSSQAPMAISKFNKESPGAFTFRVLDSDSPVRVREQLGECNPAATLVCVSSKSGSTIEPRSLLSVVKRAFAESMGSEEVPRHLLAITDSGSALDVAAREEGWLAVFNGEPSVGGRFSALSVFGLVPAALAGVDIEGFVRSACEAERRCSEDSVENPAVDLASFLFDNYRAGRDKVAYLAPKRVRILGLWIEQLVAESLGKAGQGILPYLEVDPLLLHGPCPDRVAVSYRVESDAWDARAEFDRGLRFVNPAVPCRNFSVNGVADLAAQFVIWEYATAMCGYLMRVCPFDQPDVASAKAATLDVLREGGASADFAQQDMCGVDAGPVEVRLGKRMKDARSLEQALENLFASIESGDYFALNAFVPFTGDRRRQALEAARHAVAEAFGVASCLEIGPRYLHSTGQLQKGGAGNGVILVVSAGEIKDIELFDLPASSLGALAKAQAEGDLSILSERGRRCMHVHLPDNTGAVLNLFAAVVKEAARKASEKRAQ